MVKITVNADCGNSPNKELLKDLMVQGIQGRMDYVLEALDERVLLHRIGFPVVVGKVEVNKDLEKILKHSIQEMVIHNIITHGRDTAVHGILRDHEGMDSNFCLIMTLSLGKKRLIKSIIAYII